MNQGIYTAVVVIVVNLLIQFGITIYRKFKWLQEHRKVISLKQIEREILKWEAELDEDVDLMQYYLKVYKKTNQEDVTAEQYVREFYDKYVKRKN